MLEIGPYMILPASIKDNSDVVLILNKWITAG